MPATATTTTEVALEAIAAAGTAQVKEPCLRPCAIERGMRLIGGKWKASILYHLKDGPVRFNALTRQLGGATRKMVNTRLQELEQDGLVTRHVLSERPVAVAYAITEFGESALAVLETLREWSEQHDL